MKGFIAFLLVIQCASISISNAQHDKRSSLIEPRTSCPTPNDGTRSVCKNCATVLDCKEDEGIETDCSACNMACGGESYVATCYRSYDGREPTEISNSNCLCKSDDGNGYFLKDGDYPDPFSAAYYVTCTVGVPSYHECPLNTIFDDITKSCVDGIECEEAGDYFIEMPLDCDSYITCPGGTTEDCDSDNNKIFDLSIESPDDPCIEPIADACSTPAPGSTVAHDDVCYVYYACTGISTLLSSSCCPMGQFFHSSSFTCQDIEQGSCTIDPKDVGYCVQQFWEREVCNECNEDTTKVYSTRTPCSKYYYECSDEGGEVKPHLVECPPSYPLFDPTKGYCDTAVAGCSSVL